MVCNAYYAYQEMIRGGSRFRTSFGISVIPVTGVYNGMTGGANLIYQVLMIVVGDI